MEGYKRIFTVPTKSEAITLASKQRDLGRLAKVKAVTLSFTYANGVKGKAYEVWAKWK